MADPTANLSFLPWVREGAATAIPAPDTLLPQRGVADLSASLSINGAPGAVAVDPVARAGGCHRRRCAAGRAHGAVARQPRLRAELPGLCRIRSARLPVAVHARARQRERPAAAVALPRRRARAARREHRAGERHLASGAAHRRRPPGRSTSCRTSPNAGRGRIRRSPRPTRRRRRSTPRCAARPSCRCRGSSARGASSPIRRTSPASFRRSSLGAGRGWAPRFPTAKSPPPMRWLLRGRSRTRRPRRPWGRPRSSSRSTISGDFTPGRSAISSRSHGLCIRSLRPTALVCAASTSAIPASRWRVAFRRVRPSISKVR